MAMNQFLTFPWPLMYIKKTRQSYYNRALPKSNFKSGSAPELGNVHSFLLPLVYSFSYKLN